MIISQTCLEEVIKEEKSFVARLPLSNPVEVVTPIDLDQSHPRKRKLDEPVETSMCKRSDLLDNQLDSQDNVSQSDGGESQGDSSNSEIMDVVKDDDLDEVDDAALSELQPYSSVSQLEYLDESFQLIALLIRRSAARIKDDMK